MHFLAVGKGLGSGWRRNSPNAISAPLVPNLVSELWLLSEFSFWVSRIKLWPCALTIDFSAFFGHHMKPRPIWITCPSMTWILYLKSSFQEIEKLNWQYLNWKLHERKETPCSYWWQEDLVMDSPDQKTIRKNSWEIIRWKGCSWRTDFELWILCCGYVKQVLRCGAAILSETMPSDAGISGSRIHAARIVQGIRRSFDPNGDWTCTDLH